MLKVWSTGSTMGIVRFIASNDTAAGQAQNRRTELLIPPR